ncbi:MAG: short-chain dehydrogenase [Anaerolineales bacterium]|nr:SDR family oxidoreductase [Anaerolineae bacterium]PWB50587.1 MAG: short-chain dehydrogenase [Anaerolineales bacterium]
MLLDGKLILITGAAKRVGRELALTAARNGGDLVIHYQHSKAQAESLLDEITAIGQKAHLLQADLNDPTQVRDLVRRTQEFGTLYGLVNNAAIFGSLNWQTTHLEEWNHHLMVNLTAPFLLSQAFAEQLYPDGWGRIVNLLDWRALRPTADHLPYTISKAALAALTQALAVSLAPRISVNGLALGAVLPPSEGEAPSNILKNVPAGRWADLAEVGQALVFLLAGPAYVTGEIIHLDGGRHLV